MGAWIADPAQTARSRACWRVTAHTSPVRAGGVAHLSLVWQVQSAGVAYKVSVRLNDVRGTTVWAWDRFPSPATSSATWQPGTTSRTTWE